MYIRSDSFPIEYIHTCTYEKCVCMNVQVNERKCTRVCVVAWDVYLLCYTITCLHTPTYLYRDINVDHFFNDLLDLFLPSLFLFA